MSQPRVLLTSRERWEIGLKAWQSVQLIVYLVSMFLGNLSFWGLWRQVSSWDTFWKGWQKEHGRHRNWVGSPSIIGTLRIKCVEKGAVSPLNFRIFAWVCFIGCNIMAKEFFKRKLNSFFGYHRQMWWKASTLNSRSWLSFAHLQGQLAWERYQTAGVRKALHSSEQKCHAKY